MTYYLIIKKALKVSQPRHLARTTDHVRAGAKVKERINSFDPGWSLSCSRRDGIKVQLLNFCQPMKIKRIVNKP